MGIRIRSKYIATHHGAVRAPLINNNHFSTHAVALKAFVDCNMFDESLGSPPPSPTRYVHSDDEKMELLAEEDDLSSDIDETEGTSSRACSAGDDAIYIGEAVGNNGKDTEKGICATRVARRGGNIEWNSLIVFHEENKYEESVIYLDDKLTFVKVASHCLIYVLLLTGTSERIGCVVAQSGTNQLFKMMCDT